eukprot:gene8515-6390_t
MKLCVGTTTIGQTFAAIVCSLYLCRLDWAETARLINKRANTDKADADQDDADQDDADKADADQDDADKADADQDDAARTPPAEGAGAGLGGGRDGGEAADT